MNKIGIVNSQKWKNIKMNRLESLKYFCITAETLQFKETAVRLSVSPQVVTRVIAELEDTLGEALFARNTRNVQLTPFGERFLPQAQQLLDDSEKLFAKAKRSDDEMRGVVRIAVPWLPHKNQIIADLAAKTAEFADLQLDWRVDAHKLDLVDDQIDIGVRVGTPQPLMIVRRIAEIRERIVVAPSLLAKLGKPQDLADLHRRYPVTALLNPSTGRRWDWALNETQQITPRHPRFTTNDPYAELALAVAGQSCSLIADLLCGEYLERGELVELFPEWERQSWLMYLYRPHRSVTSPRVLRVFEWLEEILLKYYG